MSTYLISNRAVTNSVYFKPTFRMDFLREEKHVFGTELSMIYAHALEAGSTPGKAHSLGLETDLGFFYRCLMRCEQI